MGEKPPCVRLFLLIIVLKTLDVSVLQVTHVSSITKISYYFSLVDVEQSYVRFLGNLILNLWDCGGQEAFMECYFAAQKDNIFKNVEVLIYVFDVQSQELDKVRNRQEISSLFDKLIFFRIYIIINHVSNLFYNIQVTQKSFVLYTKWI